MPRAQPKKIKSKSGEETTLYSGTTCSEALPAVQSDRRSSSRPRLDTLIWKALCSSKAWVQGQIDSGACTGVIYQDYQPRCALRNYDPRTSLAAQCLRLPAHNTGTRVPIPDWELRSPHAVVTSKTMTPDSGRRGYDSHGNSFPGQRLQ